MNRVVILGIAVFFAAVGLALINNVDAGHKKGGGCGCDAVATCCEPAPAPTCGCEAPKKKGLFARLKARKAAKKSSGCCEPAPVCEPVCETTCAPVCETGCTATTGCTACGEAAPAVIYETAPMAVPTPVEMPMEVPMDAPSADEPPAPPAAGIIVPVYRASFRR